MPRSSKKADAPKVTVRRKPSRRASDVSPARPTVTSTDIERLAYQIYETRGRSDGAHLDDWLEAERQLLNGV
jgi:hypothetical protein